MQIYTLVLILVASNILLFFLFWRQKQKLELIEFLLTATIETLESSLDGIKEIIDGRWSEDIKNGKGAKLMRASFLNKSYRVADYNLGYGKTGTLFKKGKNLFLQNKTFSAIFSELTNKHQSNDF